jgi:hypothetical protein
MSLTHQALHVLAAAYRLRQALAALRLSVAVPFSLAKGQSKDRSFGYKPRQFMPFCVPFITTTCHWHRQFHGASGRLNQFACQHPGKTLLRVENAALHKAKKPDRNNPTGFFVLSFTNHLRPATTSLLIRP